MPQLVGTGLSWNRQSRQFSMEGTSGFISYETAIQRLLIAIERGLADVPKLLQSTLPDAIKDVIKNARDQVIQHSALMTEQQIRVRDVNRARDQELARQGVARARQRLAEFDAEKKAEEERQKKAEEAQANMRRMTQMMGVSNIMSSIFGGGGAITSAVSGGVQTAFSGYQTLQSMGASGGQAAAGGIVMGLFSAIKDLVMNFAGLQKIISFVTGLKDLVLSPGLQLLSDLLSALGSIFNGILAPLKPFLKLLELIGVYLEAALAPALVSAWEGIVPAIETLFSTLADNQEYVAQLADGFVDLMENFPALIKLLVEGIITYLPAVINLVKLFIQQFPSIIAFLLPMLGLVIQITTLIIDNLPLLFEFGLVLASMVANLLLMLPDLKPLLEWILTILSWIAGISPQALYFVGLGVAGLLGMMAFGGPWGIPIAMGIWAIAAAPLLFAQTGTVVTSPTLALVGEKDTEFIFTKEQTAALAQMGIGGGSSELLYAIEDNSRIQRAILKSQLRLEENLKWAL